MIHLTGDIASQGVAFQEGINLAKSIYDRNKEYDVKVIFEDTRLDSAMVLRAAKKLIDFEKVDVGIISTAQEAKVAGPLFEKAKIPLICLWDSTPDYDDMGEYLFSIGTWLPFTGGISASFAKNHLKAKKAAIIYAYNQWAEVVTRDFSRKFKELGGKIVYDDFYNPSETDIRTLIFKLKSTKPDVIYAPIDSRISDFFKAIKSFNIAVPVIQSDNLNLKWINTLGGLAEGVYQSQTLSPDNEITKKMITEYFKFFGRAPDEILYNSWGYDGFNLIIEALKLSSNTKLSKRELIKSGFYKIKNYNGAIGKITINKKGSHRMPVKILQVVNAKFELVDF